MLARTSPQPPIVIHRCLADRQTPVDCVCGRPSTPEHPWAGAPHIVVEQSDRPTMNLAVEPSVPQVLADASSACS